MEKRAGVEDERDGRDIPRAGAAASGEAFVERGRSRPVKLTEVPVSKRGPILKTYCHILEFDAVAERYPTFRIDPASPNS